MAVVGLGVAGNGAGDEFGGGRSRVKMNPRPGRGEGPMVHGRANGRVLRPPGDVLSMVTRSVSSLHVCGYDGDMAGGAELSAVMANGVRGQLERRG